jgi:hypothetical protein
MSRHPGLNEHCSQRGRPALIEAKACGRASARCLASGGKARRTERGMRQLPVGHVRVASGERRRGVGNRPQCGEGRQRSRGVRAAARRQTAVALTGGGCRRDPVGVRGLVNDARACLRVSLRCMLVVSMVMHMHNTVTFGCMQHMRMRAPRERKGDDHNHQSLADQSAHEPSKAAIAAPVKPRGKCWRTHQDSNLRPLPSEGNALSS